MPFGCDTALSLSLSSYKNETSKNPLIYYNFPDAFSYFNATTFHTPVCYEFFCLNFTFFQVNSSQFHDNSQLAIRIIWICKQVACHFPRSCMTNNKNQMKTPKAYNNCPDITVQSNDFIFHLGAMPFWLANCNSFSFD